MLHRLRLRFLVVAAVAATVIAAAPRTAAAYQIDCAILLCLAGGFPPSEPCTRAHAEMIRRITPWPIEPPLQLWRCPMRAGLPILEPGGPSVTEAVFTPRPIPHTLDLPESPFHLWEAFGEDVTDYVTAIKVYDLTYRRHRNRDGDCIVSARLRMGTYDRNWDFHWGRAALSMSPDWFFDTHYTTCSGVWFRGVGMEWRDHEGERGTEVVRY
jgi:hypothetical protein